MTMRQTFGNWTQATGWTITALANNTSNTSGAIDNTTQRSYAMEVNVTTVKATGAGTGTYELWMLPEGNDGAVQDNSIPPFGGRLVGVMTSEATTTERNQSFRVNELPEKFKFYITNLSGATTAAGTDVRYRYVDFVDV